MYPVNGLAGVPWRLDGSLARPDVWLISSRTEMFATPTDWFQPATAAAPQSSARVLPSPSVPSATRRWVAMAVRTLVLLAISNSVRFATKCVGDGSCTPADPCTTTVVCGDGDGVGDVVGLGARTAAITPHLPANVGVPPGVRKRSANPEGTVQHERLEGWPDRYHPV